jgi:hypothetical protein
MGIRIGSSTTEYTEVKLLMEKCMVRELSVGMEEIKFTRVNLKITTSMVKEFSITLKAIMKEN